MNDPRDPDEILGIIRTEAAREGSPCKARAVRNFVVLYMPEAERHTWSPELTLHIDPAEEGGSLIRGLYAPNSSIGTMFMFFYIGIATFAFFAGIWGFARMALGMSYGMLWSLPGFALLALLVYLAAQAGQKLGAEQTYRLHHFFEDSIGGKARII